MRKIPLSTSLLTYLDDLEYSEAALNGISLTTTLQPGQRLHVREQGTGAVAAPRAPDADGRRRIAYTVHSTPWRHEASFAGSWTYIRGTEPEMVRTPLPSTL